MAVETTTAKVEAQGNGLATVFSFSPIVLPDSADDLDVRLRNNTTGAETVLAEGATATTYSVAVSRYPGTGSITYPAVGGTPLTSNYSIIMRRVLELKQSKTFPNQGGYFPEEVENAFDRDTMVDIQQQEQLDRTPAFLPTADLSGFDVATIPMPAPNKVVAVNAAGTGFTLVDVPSAALVAAAEAAATNAEIAQAAAEDAAVDAAAAAALLPVPANPGDDNKFLRANGGVFTLVASSVTGDVVGPASATNHRLALFDGATGKLLKDGPSYATVGYVLVSAGPGSPPAFAQLATAGITDGAVTEAKHGANSVGVTKIKREGTAGQILYSGGAGADVSWGAPPASSGEANTASNVGSNAGVWKDKSGVDLRFRTIREVHAVYLDGVLNNTSGASPGGTLVRAFTTVSQQTNTVDITSFQYFTSGGGGGS